MVISSVKVYYTEPMLIHSSPTSSRTVARRFCMIEVRVFLMPSSCRRENAELIDGLLTRQARNYIAFAVGLFAILLEMQNPNSRLGLKRDGNSVRKYVIIRNDA